jgi:hypothetical protein
VDKVILLDIDFIAKCKTKFSFKYFDLSREIYQKAMCLCVLKRLLIITFASNIKLCQ